VSDYGTSAHHGVMANGDSTHQDCPGADRGAGFNAGPLQGEQLVCPREGVIDEHDTMADKDIVSNGNAAEG